MCSRGWVQATPRERWDRLLDLGQAKLRIPKIRNTLSAVSMDASEAAQTAFFFWELPPTSSFLIVPTHRNMGRMTKIIPLKGMYDMCQLAEKRAWSSTKAGRRKGCGYPKDSMPLSPRGVWGMLLCRQASPHSTYWIKVMETQTPLLFSAYPWIRFTVYL